MNKVIILDAGHGDRHNTPGKRSPIWSDGSQYFEGEGNREIVKIATQYLKNLGWYVRHTVEPNDVRDVKLSKRIEISNLIYEQNPDAFQISVHSNGFHDESANGAEVFISNNASELSKDISEIWRIEHLFNMLDFFAWYEYESGIQWRGIKTANFAMNRVKCASILIETMFHTNEKECKILMSDNGKEQIAIAIVETAEKIHEKRNK
jgi:N-acetylmuramoyl-L-alanine amidase